MLLVLGFSWYGISWQVNERFWSNMLGRLQGPMTMRIYLQPSFAFIAALKDGIRDARFGHKAFFWTALWDPGEQPGRLREGLMATSQMALIGLAMDIIYQFRVFDRFYPVEAVMMVLAARRHSVLRLPMAGRARRALVALTHACRIVTVRTSLTWPRRFAVRMCQREPRSRGHAALESVA